ncbi:MAG: DUF63 family protein [Euryarchaeota archaeon]|nr:DUF63 family protein [Euryarchaeota archaeon]
MLSEIQQFVHQYYIDQIIHDTGYNVVNTITWAVLLGLSILPVLWILKRFKITIDRHFTIGVACFVLFGSSLRVLEDAELFAPPIKYIFVTPNIYFIVFFITVLSLAVSLRIRGEHYHRLFSGIGLCLASVNLCVLLYHDGIARPAEALLIVMMATMSTALIYLCAGHIGRMNTGFLRDRFNVAILGSHLLDASSTTVGIDVIGTYHGKHVVENYLIDLTGTGAVMYPLKLLVFIPVLYLIESEFGETEHELRDLLKLVILVLGMAPAFRNTIRIFFGV